MKLEKKTKAELIAMIEQLQAIAPTEPTAETVKWHIDQLTDLIDNQLQGDELAKARAIEEAYVVEGLKVYFMPMEVRKMTREWELEEPIEYSLQEVQKWGTVLKQDQMGEYDIDKHGYEDTYVWIDVDYDPESIETAWESIQKQNEPKQMELRKIPAKAYAENMYNVMRDENQRGYFELMRERDSREKKLLKQES